MRGTHLNRHVAMGGVGACIWSAILPLVPLRVGVAIYTVPFFFGVIFARLVVLMR